MDLRCIKAAFLFLLLILPFQSKAQQFDPDRLYINTGAHYTTLSDSDFILNSAAASSLSYENGMGFGASLGYKFPAQQKFHTRMEGELLYMRNDLKTNAQASNFFNNPGHYNAFAGMVNFLLDVPLNSAIVPYVGGGVGMAHVFTNLVSDDVFAWQLMGGVGFPVDKKHSFYAGYRFFTTVDPSFRNNGDHAEFRYQANNIEIGYRMMFGADKEKQRSAFQTRQELDFSNFTRTPETYSAEEVSKRNSEERLKYQMTQDEKATDIQPGAHAAPEENAPVKYTIQVASFSKKDNAYRTKYILKDIADINISDDTSWEDSRPLYKVTLSVTCTKAEAQALLRKIRDMGYEDAFVVK